VHVIKILINIGLPKPSDTLTTPPYHSAFVTDDDRWVTDSRAVFSTAWKSYQRLRISTEPRQQNRRWGVAELMLNWQRRYK